MKTKKKFSCDVCGNEETTEELLTVNHRGCRLKRAFPDCYEARNGLLFFDVKKIAQKIEEAKSTKKKRR